MFFKFSSFSSYAAAIFHCKKAYMTTTQYEHTNNNDNNEKNIYFEEHNFHCNEAF